MQALKSVNQIYSPSVLVGGVLKTVLLTKNRFNKSYTDLDLWPLDDIEESLEGRNLGIVLHGVLGNLHNRRNSATVVKGPPVGAGCKMMIRIFWFGLFGFLTSSSTTRLYLGRAPPMIRKINVCYTSRPIFKPHPHRTVVLNFALLYCIQM